MQEYQTYLKEFSDSRFSKFYTIDAYVTNKKQIDEHNMKKDSGYEKGINQFTGVPLTHLIKDNTASHGLGKAIKCPVESEVFST
jgi:hypothetical protein